MKLFLQKSISVVAYSSAILLILTYLSVYIDPEVFPYLAFLGLAYPVLVAVVFFFSVRFILHKKRKGYIFLLILIIGTSHFLDFFSFGMFNEPKKMKNAVKIMSYNVRMFNRYDWIKDTSTDNKIIELIKTENPDILCLQEFYSKDGTKSYQDSVIAAQNTKSYLISYKYNKNYTGNAIFSRFPIINEGIINIGTTNKKCIFADIAADNDTMRVYSLHLASIRLNYNDYDYIDGKETAKDGSTFFSIGKKIAAAYSARADELAAIIPHARKSPYPVIICGDFNDQPISYTYRQFEKQYSDAFIESGFGVGRTFTRFLPTFRIDYIFHDSTLVSSDFKRIDIELSDHYPVVCKIGRKAGI